MMNSRWPKLTFAMLFLYGAIHFSRAYSRLPGLVPSHFDAHGNPNGWETKTAFFAFSAAATLVASALVFAVPAFIRRVPLSLINLPNKNYWLAPQHSDESYAFLDSWFAWLGCAVLVILLLAFDFALGFNLRPSNPPSSAVLWYGLCGFGAFTIFWTVRLWGRFGRPPPHISTP